ncbi:MAG: 2,3,4,5-tetrahydropyridine-2,6-dicarboxylate N-succinyltransferase [Campylobacterales bacterium]
MKSIIEELWEVRDTLSTGSLKEPEIKKAIMDAIDELDNGKIRVANRYNGVWSVNEWVKKAILLYYRVSEEHIISEGHHRYFDKIPLKYDGWDSGKFQSAKVRVVPGATVRKGSFIEGGSIIMPSFIDIGSHIGMGSFIDTWATIGACAQIGKNAHIGGGVGIGGVFEPLSSKPVIIEDNCYIGARSEISEGVIVEEGSVISMGVFLSQSTRIYDRDADDVFFGRVPSGSVVVPGTLPGSDGQTETYAAIIVKTLNRKPDKKELEKLLRG